MFLLKSPGLKARREDHFWMAVDKLPMSAPPPFRSTDEEDNHHYLALFDDHLKGDAHGILINPRSIPRMRVEKGELLYADLRFESNIQLI